MSEVVTSGPFCKGCGAPVSAGPRAPCPACGETARLHGVQIGGTIAPKGEVRVSVLRATVERVRVFYERRPLWLVVALLGQIGATAVGLVFGEVGAVVGFLAGVVLNVALPAWRQKVIERGP